MRCGLSLAKAITAPHRIFVVTYAVRYKDRFELFEVGIFFKFWFFLPSPKLIFPFVLVQVLNY